MAKGKNNGQYLSDKERKRRLDALEQTKTPERPNGNISAAAKILGDVSEGTLSRWLRINGKTVGHIKAKFSKEQCIAKLRTLTDTLGHVPTRTEISKTELGEYWRTHWNELGEFALAAGLDQHVDRERYIKLLRGAPTLDILAWKMGMTRGAALDYFDGLKRQGLNVLQRGDRLSIEQTPAPVPFSEDLHLFHSDEKGEYRFGIVSDNHLCSKYAREDVLNDLYDWFQREGITRVYNAGNWIDGEARFNRHDIFIHGQDEQLKYFAANYPQREGLTTYFIAGDDHEGWYAKDKGVDIGRHAEAAARAMGREDLRYMGYMESYVKLRHSITGAESRLMIVHPGGGSAYATSYSPQKYVEALQGGEKPAVIVFGHWHKMEVFDYRNVWILQAGTTEDQTPFMRKKRLEAHVGGMIVTLEQDQKGSIIMCHPKMKRYFDRGYYANQFPIVGMPERNVVE